MNSSCSLTSVGEVTLISGVAAASNMPMMFSAFISLDGVTFGGGGTAGLSWHEKKKDSDVIFVRRIKHKIQSRKFNFYFQCLFF